MRKKAADKRKDKKKIENAEYRLKNKAKVSEYMKAWHHKNRAEMKVKHKAYYEKNREAHLAQKRAYYVANRTKLRAYAKANRHVARKNEDIRRARKAKAEVGDLKLITKWRESWRKKSRVRCYWCGEQIPGKSGSVDHIRPLARGGAHVIDNLVIACGSCNSKKHARDLTKWNAVLEQPVLL